MNNALLASDCVVVMMIDDGFPSQWPAWEFYITKERNFLTLKKREENIRTRVRKYKCNECIRDLDWTLVKVVRWLFLGQFWGEQCFFAAARAVAKIRLSLKPNCQINKLVRIPDTHGRKEEIITSDDEYKMSSSQERQTNYEYVPKQVVWSRSVLRS